MNELVAMLGEHPMALIAAGAVFLFGACIGSFLNVCIYRIPLDTPLANPPRSFCPSCRATIAWYDNMPILSWFLLRGRCRHCQATIRLRYMTVEALTGILFVLVWLKYVPLEGGMFLGMSPMDTMLLVPVYWLVVGGLILGTFVDFEHMIIPDRVTLGGIAAGLLLSLAVPALHGTDRRLVALGTAALGAAAGWGLMWGIALLGRAIFRKEAMGFGDVKLMGAIGAFFGWRSVLTSVMLSSLAGSLAGLTLIAIGRGKLKGRIPYGPYLALAALIWLYWGPRLWDAYINLFVLPERF